MSKRMYKKMLADLQLAKEVVAVSYGTDRFVVRFRQGDWIGPVARLFDWKNTAQDMANKLNAPIIEFGLEGDGMFIVEDRQETA